MYFTLQQIIDNITQKVDVHEPLIPLSILYRVVKDVSREIHPEVADGFMEVFNDSLVKGHSDLLTAIISWERKHLPEEDRRFKVEPSPTLEGETSFEPDSCVKSSDVISKEITHKILALEERRLIHILNGYMVASVLHGYNVSMIRVGGIHWKVLSNYLKHFCKHEYRGDTYHGAFFENHRIILDPRIGPEDCFIDREKNFRIHTICIGE